MLLLTLEFGRDQPLWYASTVPALGSLKDLKSSEGTSSQNVRDVYRRNISHGVSCFSPRTSSSIGLKIWAVFTRIGVKQLSGSLKWLLLGRLSGWGAGITELRNLLIVAAICSASVSRGRSLGHHQLVDVPS